MAEAEKQPQCIGFCKVARGPVPLRNKFLSVIGRPERGLQFGKSIVIEAKVRGDKLFFQDRCPGEERHGRPLRLIPRNQQDLAFPLKKSAGDVPGYVFGKGDGAVIESDVKGGSIQCHVANVVHP